MKETVSGYGYFGSVDALIEAVSNRAGNKSGGAIVYQGCRIVKDSSGEHLEGVPKTVLRVRVSPGGELNVKSDDSFDNE